MPNNLVTLPLKQVLLNDLNLLNFFTDIMDQKGKNEKPSLLP